MFLKSWLANLTSVLVSRHRCNRTDRLRTSQRQQGRGVTRIEQLEERLVLSTVSWDGGANTLNWGDAQNWSADQVPGADDDVIINVPGNITIEHSTGSDQVKSIYSEEAIDLPGGSIEIATTSQFSGGLTIDGGTLAGSGSFGGTVVWNSGALEGNFTNSGALNISGDSNHFLAGALTNAGTIVHDGPRLYLTDATLTNAASGTYDLRAGAIRENGGTNLVINAGLFEKSTGADTVAAVLVSFESTAGTTRAIAGELNVPYLTGGTGGVLDADLGASLTLNGMLNGTYNGAPAGFVGVDSGTLTGGSSARLNLSGAGFTWTSGALEGDLTNSGTLKISGLANHFLGGTFNNVGTILHDGPRLYLTDATLQNSESGIYDLRSGSINDNGGDNRFDNRGLFEKTSAESYAYVSVPFDNIGATVDVAVGALELRGGGTTSGGELNVASGATLDFAGGTHALQGVFTGSGAGLVQLSAGELAIVHTVTFSNSTGLTIVGGALSGDKTIAGKIDWQAGSIVANGLTNAGALKISGPANHFLTGTFNNVGTIVHDGSPLYLTDTTLTNAASGTYDLRAGTIRENGGTNLVINAGLFEKSTGADTLAVVSVSFSSTAGTIRAIAGELNIPYLTGGTGGVLDADLGASLTLRGTLDGTYTGAPAGFVGVDSGTLTGGLSARLNFAGSGFAWSSGALEGNLTNSGTLRISGLANHFLSGTLTNVGTIVHDGPRLYLTDGTVHNSESGTYDLQSGSVNENGGSNKVENHGVFQKTAGETYAYVAVPFDNAGATIHVEVGALGLTGGGSIAGGTYVTGTDASIQFTGGSFDFSGILNGSGTGSVILEGSTARVSAGNSVSFAIPGGLLIENGGTLTGGGTVGGVVICSAGASIAGEDGGLKNIGTIMIDGDANHFLSGKLLNSGSIIQVTGRLYLTDGELINLATGTYDFQSGSINNNGGTNQFVNHGTLRKSTNPSTAFLNISLLSDGSLDVKQGEFLPDESSNLIAIDGAGYLAVGPEATVSIRTSLVGNTTNAGQFQPAGTVAIYGGSSDAPLYWEAMSTDVGNVDNGFDHNFAYGTLLTGNSSYLQLIDLSNNSTGSGAEAVYVDHLIVGVGATLDLNSLHVYTRTLDNHGSIIGGTVEIVPLAASLQSLGNARVGAVDSIDVTFTRPINAASLSIGDFTLMRDGGMIPLLTNQTIEHVTGNIYRIGNLSGLTTINGYYSLTLDTSKVEAADFSTGVDVVSTEWNKVGILLSGSDTVVDGTVYDLTLGDVDPGLGTIYAYVVHWGDDTTDTYTAAQVAASNRHVTHTYYAENRGFVVSVDLQTAANPRSLDSSFGNNGTTLFTGFGPNVVERALAIDNEGRAVVFAVDLTDGGRAYKLARFTTDGVIDSSFGIDGIVELQLPDVAPNGQDLSWGDQYFGMDGMAIDQYGRMLLTAGATLSSNDDPATNTGDIAILRFDATGSLDTTFGTAGLVLLDITGPSSAGVQRWDEGTGIALDVFGNILICGDTVVSGPAGDERKIIVARFDSNGALDPTFGEMGIRQIDTTTGSSDIDRALDLTVLRDGRIVVIGPPGMTRLNADGTTDMTFGFHGFMEIGSGPGNLRPYSVNESYPGDLMLGGPNFQTNNVGLTKYFSTGWADISFGDLAFAAIELLPGGSVDIKIDGLGRYLIAREAYINDGTPIGQHPVQLARWIDGVLGNAGKTFVIATPAPNVAPTDIGITSDTTSENEAVNTSIGIFFTTDNNHSDVFNYSLVSGPGSIDNHFFQIIGNQLYNKFKLDFEAQSTYSIRVRTTDRGGLWYEENFTIHVTDANENSIALNLAGASVTENQPSGTAVGTFTTMDPDGSDLFTYSLVGGPGSGDNGSFSIAGNQLLTSATFNYESQVLYSIRVRSTDQGGLWIENTFTITVTDVNEAPSLYLYNVVSRIDENTDTAEAIKVTEIYIVDDSSGLNMLSLAGADAAFFELAGNALFIRPGTILDFETKSTYQLTVRVDDSSVGMTPDASVNYTLTVNDLPESTAPVVTAFDTDVIYKENAAPVVLDTDVVIADSDSPDFGGGFLTVALVANGEEADQLTVRHQGASAKQVGVAGNQVMYSGVVIGTIAGGTTGSVPLTISFNTAATKLAVQAVLRDIVYSSTSDNPSIQPKTVQVQVYDGDGGLSSPVVKMIKVTPANDRSVLSNFAGTIAYTENDDPEILTVDSTVFDPDSSDFDLGKLTIKVAANAQTTDRIAIRNQGVEPGQIGISGTDVTYGGIVIGTFGGTTTLTVTLNGLATVEAVQALLRNVTYSNVSNAPSVLPRTISAVLNDGDGGTSVTATMSVVVNSLNDDPMIGAFDTDTVYKENALPVQIDNNTVVADGDLLNFERGVLTVDLVANGDLDDRLSIRNQGTTAGLVGILGSDQVTYAGVVVATFTGGTSGQDPLVVVFNASAMQPAVQAVVRNLIYNNVSDNPSILPRTVRLQLTDGDGGTAIPATKTILVTAINDAPVLGNFASSSTYVEDNVPAVLVPAATVFDVDSSDFSLGKLVAKVSANAQSTDRVSIRNQGTGEGQIGISGTDVTFGGTVIGSFAGTVTLTVTLNSNATRSAVEALLQNLTFSSVSQAPSTLQRTISVTLSDGDGGTSAAVTTTVSVTAINDAPVLGGTGSAVTYKEGAAGVVIVSTATVTDVDLVNFDTGVLTVSYATASTVNDRLEIKNVGTGTGQIGINGDSVTFGGIAIGTFTGGNSGSNLVVIFNSNANATAIQALLKNITFRVMGSLSANSTRTVRFSLTDGDGGTSNDLDRQVNVINLP